MTATTDGRPGTRGRTRRRWGLLGLGAVGLALVVGVTIYLWLRATSDVRQVGTSCADAPATGSPTSESDARAGICRTLDALVASWNRGDAAGYGARFTDHATYAAFTGTVYEGREDIAAGHAALFAGVLRGSRLDARYLSIDFPAPGVARVLARGDTYEGDTPPATLSKVQTYLMVEQGGDWKVAAFHNTQRAPVMERIQFLVDPGSRPLLER
jgi:uncharacterized protein (TIGR02246 family)